mgnify:CR=1 FL=1
MARIYKLIILTVLIISCTEVEKKNRNVKQEIIPLFPMLSWGDEIESISSKNKNLQTKNWWMTDSLETKIQWIDYQLKGMNYKVEFYTLQKRSLLQPNKRNGYLDCIQIIFDSDSMPDSLLSIVNAIGIRTSLKKELHENLPITWNVDNTEFRLYKTEPNHDKICLTLLPQKHPLD